jgi:chlorite dismutase
MSDENKVIGHFSVYSFNEQFWNLESTKRKEIIHDWLEKLNKATDNLAFYQVFPNRKEGDLLLWSSKEVIDTQTAHTFMTEYAKACTPFRKYFKTDQTLWGMTKPSMYSKRKTVSDQEILPMEKKRTPYLIIYPFTKTVDWYLKGRETRQGMMNEHIRIGREYPQIKQLLLYSVGLQDDEFVVVYETDDIGLFSDLVYQLRSTQARVYTKNDVPIITAANHSIEEISSLFS